MNPSNESFVSSFHKNQNGASSLKSFIIIGLLIAAGYFGYQYVPVAYEASLFKVFMQDTTNKASALGKNGAWLEQQLRANSAEYELPQDAVITVTPQGQRLTARVQYKKEIPMVFYTYEFDFDHTVTSSGFFNAQ